uniref:Protein KTI12 homolog n=1 Tax=Timema californicum TaxID=61474 RepID=A0A7R9J262_TIMCA|nr:unnamed protein product [Timema californicum]
MAGSLLYPWLPRPREDCIGIVRDYLDRSTLGHVVTNAAIKGTSQDSSKEKEIRGLIKAETQRLIGRESVVIIDAGNYIKGYRYELYCMSKSSKTTQCTIQCETPTDTARQWNEGRGDDTYSQDVFDALIMRYEAPDSRNRWDSPLFLVLPSDGLPLEQIKSALFDRKAPPPNQSTQCAPLSSTNFLYDLDRVTQDIVSVSCSWGI